VLGHTTQSGVVPRLSATPGGIRHTGPDLAADTRAVLAEELGLSTERIAELAAAGAVRLPADH